MIEFRELTRRYGSVPAVDGLSCDVEPGEVTGFLGPNGAGTSTWSRSAPWASRHGSAPREGRHHRPALLP